MKTNQLAIFQEHFLNYILEGKKEITNEEIIARKEILCMDRMELPLVVICIAPYFELLDFQKKDAAVFACRDLISSFFEHKRLKAYYYINSYDNIQVLLHIRNKMSIDEICMDLYHEIQNDFDIELFIGIGSVVNEYQNIAASAAEATQMLAYKYVYAEQGVINIRNIFPFQYNVSYASGDMLNRVIGCFQDGDLGKMSTRLNELAEYIRYRPHVSGNSIKRTMIEVTVHILHIAANAGINVDIYLEGRDPYRWIMEQDRTEIITGWIMDLSAKFLNAIQESKEQKTSTIVSAAKQYIEENFEDVQLGLQQVSSEMELSPSYFSKLFKSETGIGVSNYISEVRVIRAKKLLKESSLKIDDIARQTGFSSQNYFCNVFKKICGYSPGEYRKMNKKKS